MGARVLVWSFPLSVCLADGHSPAHVHAHTGEEGHTAVGDGRDV